MPPYGGDTLFANQYLAWESLPEGMRDDRQRDGAPTQAPRELAASHPVARTQPETGRIALYVNIAHALRFDGMKG